MAVATAQRDTAPSNAAITTSSPDVKLVSDVMDMFRRARGRRRSLVDRWVKSYEVLTNRTWLSGRPDWMPAPALPEIYPIISSIVGWQTDQRVRFDCVAAAEPHSHTAAFYEQLGHDLRNVMNSIWSTEDYDGEISKVIWDAYLYGTGITKVIWDARRAGGMGNPIITRVDPFTFYPDPEARGMHDAAFFIECKTLSYEEVEARWPGSLKKLGVGGGLVVDVEDQSPTQLDAAVGSRLKTQPSAAISPNTDPSYVRTKRIDATETQGVTVLEAWLRVPAEEDAFPELPGFDAAAHNNPLYDEDATPTPPPMRRYDKWRCVVIAGQQVLMDEAAEDLWAHGQHPFGRYVIDDLGEFWGASMVEMLAPAQVSLNRLLASIEQNIWLMGNPVFVESVRAGLRQTQITNKPGTRLTVNDGGQAEWLQPPQIHPQMSNDLIQFYIGEMERISGLSAIVRGATPTGRNAQGVLDSVQDAAFVRIRKAQRSLERTLHGDLTKAASLVCEFYDSPRLINIIGDDGNKSAVALRTLHFYLPTSNGRAPLQFSILVQAGSSLPTSHGQRAAEADTLYAMGCIDEEAVLEAHDWPDRARVTARVREMKAAAGTLGQPPGARQRARR